MMRSNKPKVFISSTIYDFRDLRSTIKLWLEEYGYDVLMSEVNDFPLSPDQNSLDNCLKAIDKCDYYILLIGSRVGAWHNRRKLISITRKEYRHAYSRLKKGNLKLLTFVRKELWDICLDREELRDFLQENYATDKELSDVEIKKVINHPSRFMNDANFITDFLNEVGRIKETKVASEKTGDFPSGNWIYQFSSFSDIIDALGTVLNLSGNLRQKTLRINLKHEILAAASVLLENTSDGLRKVNHWSYWARKDFKGRVTDTSKYKGQHLLWLKMFFISAMSLGGKLKNNVLHEAVISGEFLDFDKSSGIHLVGLLQSDLIQLDAQINQLMKLESSELFSDTLKSVISLESIDSESQIDLQNQTLIVVFALHDIIDNILALCKSIYITLENPEREHIAAKLHPSSPLEVEGERIKSETTSIDDAQRWLET